MKVLRKKEKKRNYGEWTEEREKQKKIENNFGSRHKTLSKMFSQKEDLKKSFFRFYFKSIIKNYNFMRHKLFFVL